MWKQGFNSLREGVREFSQSALDEVKQGSSFVRASSASSELADSPTSSRSINLHTGGAKAPRVAAQAAGATAVVNGWDQDVVPAASEHSTDSMRSSRHAGSTSQHLAHSPEPAKVASATASDPQQSRRASSRDASPNVQKKKAGHHRRKSSSSKPAAPSDDLTSKKAASPNGSVSLTTDVSAPDQQIAQHETSDAIRAGSANSGPAAPSQLLKSHGSVSPTTPALPVTQRPGSSVNGHSQAETADMGSDAASNQRPLNHAVLDHGDDPSTPAAFPSKHRNHAAQSSSNVDGKASKGVHLHQGLNENSQAGPQQAASAAASGEAALASSMHHVRREGGQESSQQRKGQEGPVHATDLLPSAMSARDVDTGKRQELTEASKLREDASGDPAQPDNEPSGSQQSPEAEAPSLPLSSSNVIKQLKAQGNPDNRPQAQQEQSTAAAQSTASDMVSPAAVRPAAEGISSSTAQGSLRERLQRAEEALAAAEQERADMESSVTALAEDLEQRIQDMSSQLEARERQLAATRQELEDMEAGFHGNKRLLQQSGEERTKLAASERALQKQLQQAFSEAQQAQRESARHAADAAVARTELQQSNAEQQQEHRQALDSLRSTLQRDADLAKEGLQAAERQAGASEQQLASLHSSLAASEDRRRAAESQAEAAEATSASEREQRIVAEALAQQLQAEGARRAHVFNAAVRSAVSKIQSQLEAERDQLGARVGELEAQVAGLQQDAEAQSAGLEAANAAAATHQQQLAAVEQRAAAAALEAAAALDARQVAEQALQDAESSSSIHAQALAEADSQAAEAQERCNELAAAVAAAEGRAAGAEAAREAAEQDLQREVQRWKLQAEAASRAAKLMDHSSSASARETTEEVKDLRQHVHDLQAEVADLQAALRSQTTLGSSSAARRQLPSDFLADLGTLDLWQGNRLRASTSEIDLEDPKHEGKSEPWLAGHRWRWLRIAAGHAQRLSKYAEAQLSSSSWGPGLKQMVATKGRVSGRFWLVAAYLFILHLTLMISFTKSSQPDLDTLCAPKQGLRLPG